MREILIVNLKKLVTDVPPKFPKQRLKQSIYFDCYTSNFWRIQACIISQVPLNLILCLQVRQRISKNFLELLRVFGPLPIVSMHQAFSRSCQVVQKLLRLDGCVIIFHGGFTVFLRDIILKILACCRYNLTSILRHRKLQMVSCGRPRQAIGYIPRY